MNEADDILNEALGSGPEFPTRINQRGGLAVARGEQKVKQSIISILSTAPGERVMRPDFGCGIHAFVFASLDTTTLSLIRSVVEEALVRWEPRIKLENVRVEPDAERDGWLSISIDYSIRATNSPANLVYPFYLETGT